MKKTYINPIMNIVTIQTHQMLAHSGDTLSVDTSQQVNPNVSDARGGWFDEDEE